MHIYGILILVCIFQTRFWLEINLHRISDPPRDGVINVCVGLMLKIVHMIREYSIFYSTSFLSHFMHVLNQF